MLILAFVFLAFVAVVFTATAYTGWRHGWKPEDAVMLAILPPVAVALLILVFHQYLGGSS